MNARPPQINKDTFDAWTNAITALGIAGRDASTETKFTRSGAADERAQLLALYEEDWLFARCIDAVPEYGTQKWIRLGARSDTGSVVRPKWAAKILDKLDRLSARDRFEHAWKLDRLDGGSYVVIGTNGGKGSLESPLTLDNVESVDFLNVVSRYDVNPFNMTGGNIERDPTSINYLKPEFYTLTGTKQTKIHNSRLIRFEGLRRASSATEFTDHGMSISHRIFDAVRMFGEAFGYYAASFKHMVQGILRMKGLANMLAADDEGQALLVRRLSAMAIASSAFHVKLLDEDESYENIQIDFTGSGSAILRVMDLVAGAAETPLSILFGQAPTGLSTDDEGGRKAFYSMVSRQQGSKLRTPLRWLIDLLMHSEDLGEDSEPDSWFLEFVPLDEPSAKEQSEIDRNEAETDAIRVREGILTESEVRSRISKDPHSPYDLDEGFEPSSDPGLPDPNINPLDPSGNVGDENKPGVGQDVQSTLPNGAQLESMRNTIMDVASGKLSRESGEAFIMINFGLSKSQASALLGPKEFKPKEEEKAPIMIPGAPDAKGPPKIPGQPKIQGTKPPTQPFK